MTWGELRDILQQSGEGDEADFDTMLEMLAELVEFSNMNARHTPYAKSHPPPT